MTRCLRTFFGLFLAFVLSVTAQSMAIARTSASPTGDMILCTGTGPVTIQVDAEGNPTGPAHICPDCAISIFQMDFFVPGAVPETVWTAGVFSADHGTDQPFAIETRATARAPPANI